VHPFSVAASDVACINYQKHAMGRRFIYFLAFSASFLFLFHAILTSDGIIIRSSSKPFEVVTVLVAVGLVALGVDRLVRGWREE